MGRGLSGRAQVLTVISMTGGYDTIGSAGWGVLRAPSVELISLSCSVRDDQADRRRGEKTGSLGPALLEFDDRADDLGLLARLEGLVDLGEVDAPGDHALQVELALPPQAQQLVEVRADVGRAV